MIDIIDAIYFLFAKWLSDFVVAVIKYAVSDADERISKSKATEPPLRIAWRGIWGQERHTISGFGRYVSGWDQGPANRGMRPGQRRHREIQSHH
jgi:hypothetical protein